jgi:hypothetical protein
MSCLFLRVIGVPLVPGASGPGHPGPPARSVNTLAWSWENYRILVRVTAMLLDTTPSKPDRRHAHVLMPGAGPITAGGRKPAHAT